MENLKEFKRKFEFKKEVISNLNRNDLSVVQGGKNTLEEGTFINPFCPIANYTEPPCHKPKGDSVSHVCW